MLFRSTGNKQEIKRIAEFNGRKVTLTSNGIKSEYEIDETFIIDGSYFTNSLIRAGFKKGLELRAKLYEPTVEIDRTILVIVNVTGREKIMVNGRAVGVIHIKQRVEKLKHVDIYINEEGVTEKLVIKMLNNVFEMERI